MTQQKNISHITAVIEAEYPQTAAILLFSLSPEDAGSVLKELSTGLALELAERIYSSGEVDSEITDKLFAGFETFDLDARRLDRDKNQLLLDALACSGYVKQRDILRELADTFSIHLEYNDIRMIEDIITCEDSRLSELLSTVEQNDLTLALRIADEEIKEKIFRCIDTDIASEIRSDLEWGGAVLMDDSAAASEKIISLFNNAEC